MQPQDMYELIGKDAYDSDGQKVGRIGQVFLDDRTNEPTWATVSTGLFGTRESFVPLDGSDFDGDRLHVAYPKARIKDAPNVGNEGHLSPEEEDRLYAFYEVADPSPADATSTGAAATTQGTPATPSVSADTDNDAMTRSEERLHVDTTARVSGRARMRKYVVTEEVQVTVPVRREKVVLETESGEPIHPNESDQLTSPTSDAAAPASGQGPSSRTAADDSLSHDEQTETSEMILHEERPVVTTETVPVQRVRLGATEDIVEETITEEVRKERVQLDDDTETPPHR
jgi:stress response protein YsnF